MAATSNKTQRGAQRGGFALGVVVGLLVGLALALGVALYVTKVPVPFVDKVPQRTAEQDAAEAEKKGTGTFVTPMRRWPARPARPSRRRAPNRRPPPLPPVRAAARRPCRPR